MDFRKSEINIVVADESLLPLCEKGLRALKKDSETRNYRVGQVIVGSYLEQPLAIENAIRHFGDRTNTWIAFDKFPGHLAFFMAAYLKHVMLQGQTVVGAISDNVDITNIIKSAQNLELSVFFGKRTGEDGFYDACLSAQNCSRNPLYAYKQNGLRIYGFEGLLKRLESGTSDNE